MSLFGDILKQVPGVGDGIKIAQGALQNTVNKRAGKGKVGVLGKLFPPTVPVMGAGGVVIPPPPPPTVYTGSASQKKWGDAWGKEFHVTWDSASGTPNPSAPDASPLSGKLKAFFASVQGMVITGVALLGVVWYFVRRKKK